MAYTSKNGRRPMEYASKSSHSHIINDPSVQEFLKNGEVPKKAEDITLPQNNLVPFIPNKENPITNIIAIDGGYEEIPVQSEFPSSLLCFFQFGALVFGIDDLENIDNMPFINPEDMAKLKEIQRLPFTLPVKNYSYKGETRLTHSVRRAVYDFFTKKIGEDETLMETLRWFIFQEYQMKPETTWVLSSCPYCGERKVPLIRAQMTKDYTFLCPNPDCLKVLYLSDVLRLHEAVDDEMGAGGILGYVSTSFEQFLLIHLIRLILKIKPSVMNQTLFIKDGPLAFFGQTANMHTPMRSLCNFLFDNHNLFMAGLEKSGTFVEHADQIADKLPSDTILLLDNDYIYKYIIPGNAKADNTYGETSYYSNKVVFKTKHGGMYVVSLPTKSLLSHPKIEDFQNVQAILTNIEKLKCDMYDNALLPVALANKLVSLSQYPSSRILQRFALGKMHS